MVYPSDFLPKKHYELSQMFENSYMWGCTNDRIGLMCYSYLFQLPVPRHLQKHLLVQKHQRSNQQTKYQETEDRDIKRLPTDGSTFTSEEIVTASTCWPLRGHVGKTTMSGKVSDVCPKMGCWMVMSDRKNMPDVTKSILYR